MEKNNTIYLKTEDLQNFKKIGHGTDGIVYKYKNNYLIKIYYSSLFYDSLNKKSFDKSDDSDIKIYQKGIGTINNPLYNSFMTFYDYSKEDQIRISPQDAIKRAIELNKYIEFTDLPVGIVYLNNRFSGCLLYRKRGIQIHKLIGLPLNIRKRIYLNILKAEAELLKNNIYHCDLSNSPFAQRNITLPNGEVILCGHSHILVNPFSLNTHFIDLEGKSTIYTNKESEYYKHESESELTKLTTEFLLQIDLEEYKENPEEMIPELIEKGITSSTLQRKIYEADMSLDELSELNRILKK